MTQPSLPVLALPSFPQNFTHALSQLLGRVDRVLIAHPILGTCDYESDCDCRRPATVHHLKSEREYCAAHFRKVSRG